MAKRRSSVRCLRSSNGFRTTSNQKTRGLAISGAALAPRGSPPELGRLGRAEVESPRSDPCRYVERALERVQEARPRPLRGAEGRQVLGRLLAVEETETPGRQIRGERRQADLGGVRDVREHRLPEEDGTEGHAV